MIYINKIRVQNFKSLKDFEIEMKPLMFLFGINSSGKSSFIKSLVFLSKNLFPISEKGVNFKLSEHLNLQNYLQIVHNADKSLKIEYCIDLFFPVSDVFPVIQKVIWGKKEEEQNVNHFQIKVVFCYSDYISSYISEITIIDITNDITFGYKKRSFSWDIEIISNNINIDLIKDYFGIIKKDNNYYQKIANPFEDLSPKESQRFLNYLCEYLINDKGVLEKQLSEPKYWETDGRDYLQLFRIFATIYYEIPNALSIYFKNIHIPGIREIPKERYELGGDLYLLGNNEFSKYEYYDLLNSLYNHQSSLKHLSKDRSVGDIDFLNTYIKLFNKAHYLLAEFTSLELQEITDTFNNLLYTRKIETYEEALNYIKNNEAGSITPIMSRFIRLSNKKKYYYYYLHKNNDHIISHEAFGTYSEEQKDNLSILTNASIFVNHIIKKLGFDSMIYISKDEGYGKLFSIKNNRDKYYLNNESSGFLQLLPFLFGLVKIYASSHLLNMSSNKRISRMVDEEDGYFYYENEERALYIEQPELHLHPKMQAKIVEFMVEVANEFNNYNTLIVETHSEHIIKKIQIEIAKGNISNENVGVYFFNKKDNTTFVNKIRINEIGQLEKEFPDGFFDDSLKLTYEFYEALKNKN